MTTKFTINILEVGQRHSTGGCGTRLAPSYTPESQSAPTSPALVRALLKLISLVFVYSTLNFVFRRENTISTNCK